MPNLPAILAPYLGTYRPPVDLYPQLSTYLDLLLKWNARTNLTAIRDPDEIVRRHFGESLFAGVHLAAKLASEATLLDLGSGAGFPGLPIQLLLPGLQVTLAESQNKKATFLREAVRTLGLPTRVHAARAETLTSQFDCVTLRAVDHMSAALLAAQPLLKPSGWLAVLTADPSPDTAEVYPLPNTTRTTLTLIQRS
jgi:16S rRNA (guanine527-N7)-methyltransferase